MKTINYAYVNPGGNPTALILDRVERKNQALVAKKLLKSSAISCEQVGFLEPAKKVGAILRLQMMGGEFCGNGLRALVAYLATKEEKIRQNGILKYQLESSGTDALIKCAVKIGPLRNVLWSEINLVVPRADFLAEKTKLLLNSVKKLVPRVDLEGISHLFAPFAWYKPDFNFRKLLSQYLMRTKLNIPAIGLTFFRKLAKNKYSILPIVYVKGTNSAVSETSCVSGTISLALLNFSLTQSGNIFVKQPSGAVLRAKLIQKKDKNFSILIRGPIYKIKTGQVKV